MNKKGFTIIELGMSFCIVSAIAIVLFQLVVSIKDLYLAGNVKTTLLNKQGIMTKRINDDLVAYDLKKINSCGISCLEFSYAEKNETEIVKTSKLMIDPYNVSISYDDYTIELEMGSSFKQTVVDYTKVVDEGITDNNNTILQIKIPVQNKLVDGDFGLNLIIQYNDQVTEVNNELNIDSAILTLDNQDLTVKELYKDGVRQGTYARVFYHNITSGLVFGSKDELIKSNEENKYSALFALDSLKGKYNSANKDSLEFLLYYPSTGGTNYNRWVQTNNFIKEKLSGYEAIDIKWSANGKWNGLDYVNNDCTFVNGVDDKTKCDFAIGSKTANALTYSDSSTYQSQDVELWVRIDDYINQYSLSQIIS